MLIFSLFMHLEFKRHVAHRRPWIALDLMCLTLKEGLPFQ
jgi:hypothetical protein